MMQNADMITQTDGATRINRIVVQNGFTLIELMITVTIAAILATIAVPAFNDAVLGSKLNSMANSFVASAQLARSEAIKRNTPVRLCAGSDCTGAWKDGWVVLAGATVIHTQAPLPNGFLLSGGGVTTITFQPSGLRANDADTSLTLCRSAPTPGSQKRTIKVSVSGRPSVEKGPATSCP